MKFWNKDKDTRRTHWTRVVVDDWSPEYKVADAKRWCQQQGSDGKFYYNYVWHFERAEDATMFMLRWA